MVAELLRLRLRVVANGFRGGALRAVGVALAWIAGIVGTVLLLVGAEWMSHHSDVFVTRATIAVGTWLLLAAFIIPMITVRTEPLAPRAFLGYPISNAAIGVATFLLPLIGPTILLIPAALAPAVAWGDEPSALPIAQAAVPLIVILAMQLLDLGRQAGVALRHRSRAAKWADVLGALALIVGLVIVLIVLSPRISELRWVEVLAAPVRTFVLDNLDAVAMTPFGILWAAIAQGALPLGDPEAAWARLWFSVAVIVVLAGVRAGLVQRQLQAARRAPAPRRVRVPGWFRQFGATPVGAVGARSTTYWIRDPRYYATLAIVPVLPALILLAFWIGGVPFQYAVLVPLPVLALFIGWATIHNDTAYDSTAFWQHLSAQVRGTHDRQGRTVPVLVIGAALLAIGVPLTAWGYGSTAIIPPLTGVCLALLLGGIGVGSAYSARFPYAAPRPGDPAWRSPQVVGSIGGVAQSMSLLFSVLVAAPAFLAAAAWWLMGGRWGWIALGVGAVSGLVAYFAGIRIGGLVVDRRGSELLAFTMRH